jgi:hypothetical protein
MQRQATEGRAVKGPAAQEVAAGSLAPDRHAAARYGGNRKDPLQVRQEALEGSHGTILTEVSAGGGISTANPGASENPRHPTCATCGASL